MQRREFFKGALLGAGALYSMSLPLARNAFAADGELRAELARITSTAGQLRWQCLEQCTATSCAIGTRFRVVIDRLDFPSGSRALAIDAMLVTDEGLRPFRIASFEPGALSPKSKPHAFEVDASGWSGLRIERRARAGEGNDIAQSDLLDALRPQLAPGRYLLGISTSLQSIDFASLVADADSTSPAVHRNGSRPDFATIGFTVHAIDA